MFRLVSAISLLGLVGSWPISYGPGCNGLSTPGNWAQFNCYIFGPCLVRAGAPPVMAPEPSPRLPGPRKQYAPAQQMLPWTVVGPPEATYCWAPRSSLFCAEKTPTRLGSPRLPASAPLHDGLNGEVHFHGLILQTENFILSLLLNLRYSKEKLVNQT